MVISFREVLGAVDPAKTVHSAQRLAQFIGEPVRPLSLRRLMHHALAFRVQHQGLIRHVFVLMLENRSFDHIFGYSGIVGRDSATDERTEVEGLTRHHGTNVNPTNGQSISTSPTASFSLAGVASDVEHEFLDVLMQLCGPKQVPRSGVLPGGAYPHVDNSGFVANFVTREPTSPPETPMKCFTPANLPVLNTLAIEFVICDHWFASHPGPTWPNRFFVHAASPSTAAQVDSPSGMRIAETYIPGVKFHFANGTIYDRLAAKGLKHKIYSGNDCPQVKGIRGNRIDLNIANLSSLRPDLQGPNFEFSYIFIEPDNGLRGIAGAIADCNSGIQNDMHPPSDVRPGEALIKEVYEAIKSSGVWNQSVFVILFDEHGGFFDHVNPPGPPIAVPPGDGAVDDDHNFQFNQLGVRIPAVVVSPWVGRNVVDHTQYDHTSLLATVEKLFGLDPLTQRDAAANDFLEVFSQITPRTDAPETLPSPAT
jgi:phospholipase C